MGRKVYHVYRFDSEHMATFTSVKKALDFAKHKFYNEYDHKDLTITSYDLKTHVHLDIWFSSFLEKEKGEQK